MFYRGCVQLKNPIRWHSRLSFNGDSTQAKVQFLFLLQLKYILDIVFVSMLD